MPINGVLQPVGRTVVVTLLVLGGSTVVAQQLTIPQALARAGVDLGGGAGVGSGILGDVNSTEYFERYTRELIADTDTLITGTVGQPGNAYLSEDQREVYTDYVIEHPVFLYQRAAVSSTIPGAAQAASVT